MWWLRLPHWCADALAAWLVAAFLLALPTQAPAQDPARAVTVLEVAIGSAISPIQAEHLEAALNRAGHDQADAVLLTLDTPGGSIEVMRRMVKALLASPVPVVVYVAPSGARAASAGVFLVAAARIAAMAPQTTIGSASPVGPGGGDIKGDMHSKIQNDLMSLLRGLAGRNDRNVDWYLRSVTKAANLDALEAVRERVVDLVAVSRADLMDQLGKRGLDAPRGLLHFTAGDVRFIPFTAGLRHDVLSWLLDPQIAYVLLLIGLAGLYFELTTPGAVLPGVIGSLSLLLALYALSVLPTNTTGLLLLALGGVFFLLEVSITSYGLLALAGVASLLLGSVLLFRGDGLGGLPLGLILPTVLGLCALLGALGYVVARSQWRRPQSGTDALLGQRAEVRSWAGNSGKVSVRGELWQARSSGPLTVSPGQTVVVMGRDDLTLLVAADDGTAS